jgi:flagellar biosynthesis protein FlhG
MFMARAPQVIGIASGKGGVGKTTVTVNLALTLARQGYQVAILDADLGLANAQLALGSHGHFHLGHVLNGDKTLQDILLTPFRNLRLIPGASGVRELAALDPSGVASIVHALDDLPGPLDYLLVDIAPGISPAVITFLAACQRRFVVVCDQPASIADAYGLIKIMAREEGLREIYVIPNMVEHQAAGERLYGRLNEVTGRFLDGVQVAYLTSIEHDGLMLESSRNYRPVAEYAPGGTAARDFRRLARMVTELPAIEPVSGRLQFLLNQMVRSG